MRRERNMQQPSDPRGFHDAHHRLMRRLRVGVDDDDGIFCVARRFTQHLGERIGRREGEHRLVEHVAALRVDTDIDFPWPLPRGVGIVTR